MLLCETIANKEEDGVYSYLYQDQCLKQVSKEVNWTTARDFCQENYQVRISGGNYN